MFIYVDVCQCVQLLMAHELSVEICRLVSTAILMVPHSAGGAIRMVCKEKVVPGANARETRGPSALGGLMACG